MIYDDQPEMVEAFTGWHVLYGSIQRGQADHIMQAAFAAIDREALIEKFSSYARSDLGDYATLAQHAESRRSNAEKGLVAAGIISPASNQ